MHRLKRLSSIVAIAVCLAFLGALSGCHNMLLFRVPLSPVKFAGLPGFEQVSFKTPDSETLDGWYAPPIPGKPLVLMFHGSQGRERGYSAFLNKVHAAGYGILLAAFRGYPPSTGHPSQQGLYTDGLAMFDFANAKCGCSIVLFGHSLGSGIAVHTAALRQARAVLLVSPYSSVADVAASRFRFLPVRKRIKNEFPSMQWIGKVTEPLLILHGELDTTIPEQFAKKLFDAANQPKRFELFKGVGHHLLWMEDLMPWLDVLLKMDPATPR